MILCKDHHNYIMTSSYTFSNNTSIKGQCIPRDLHQVVDSLENMVGHMAVGGTKMGKLPLL